MKHLSRLLVALLFFFGFTTVQAQNEDNPWAISVGMNAVDFYPVGGGPGGEGTAQSESMFGEYFNAKDHWNILPSISKLSINRYVGYGLVVGVSGSINRINKVGDMRVDDLSYYAVDGMVKYTFGELLNTKWFDPYLGVGGGYAWVDNIGAGTGNGTLGINFWVSDRIAFNVESTYKSSFKDYLADHFQHSVGVTFNFGGKDTDGDGIYDKNDACPDVPGLAEFKGCPDTDGDGITDAEDNCPDTPGLAEFNGCADSDGDGIADPNDNCPTVAGIASLNGCPDADGDGIKDADDKCPNEAGPASNNGCPYTDVDGDGVLDKDDQCPDVAGTKANNGCPQVTVEVINQLNQYSKTILFDLSKASIRKESYDALDAIVDIMKEYDNAEFHIAGYTDSSGSEKLNEKLSKERAASVRSYIVAHGIGAGQITSEGYGEDYPIATNKTAAGRQQNRRVEVTLEKNRPEKK